MKNGGMKWRFVWISIFPFTWLECNSRESDKIALFPFFLPEGKLSPSTVPLFRNDANQEVLATSYLTSNSRETEKGEQREGERKRAQEGFDRQEQPFQPFALLTALHVLLLAFRFLSSFVARGSKAHSC